MTLTSSERRWSNSSNHAETFKFPDFESPVAFRDLHPSHEDKDLNGSAFARTANVNANTLTHNERWQPRRGSHLAWSHANGRTTDPNLKNGRQKSISDAIKTIRSRKGSVSANAQEIAEALKAPVSVKLVVCLPLSTPHTSLIN